MSDPISRSLFERATRVIPGGVNSPVRAFRAVGGCPCSCRARRGHTWSAPTAAVRGLRRLVGTDDPRTCAPGRGRSRARRSHPRHELRRPTELEVRFAEKVCALYPSIEMMRAVSSGTEATMSALRAARGFTGRDVVVKFEGCYHGHADSCS